MINEDLVDKYKQEFKHWLGGGAVLFKWQPSYSAPNCWLREDDIVTNHLWEQDTNAVKYIVIKDKYVESRKASAEGIKHKFKVGDWIRSRDGLDISKVTEDTLRFYKDGFNVELEDEWELWAPVDGEWCWFWYTNCSPTLAQYVDFDGDEFIANVFSSNHKNNRRHRTEYYPNCAPFIGALPDYLKEK